MSHPFGDLIAQHLHRKHGLSQAKLAAGVLQAPTVISRMCRGERLTGPQARERVLAIIGWLREQGALETAQEANALLNAAGMAPLRESVQAEEALVRELSRASRAPQSSPAQAPVVPDYALVGRHAEWQVLRATWQRAAQGAAHFVTIAGDAGIGKTRLAEELLVHAQREGHVAARTRAYALEGRLAYAPVAEWLRSPALAGEVRRLDRVWRGELARVLPELLIEDPGLPAPQPLAERWQRKQLFEALVHAFSAGRERALLLVLDDVQWCDAETLAWLHYLLAAAPRLKVLIVGTVRDAELEAEHPLHALWRDLARDGQVTRMTLAPLSAAETARLGASVAYQALEAREAARLYAQSAGNPLFAIESVRSRDGEAGGDGDLAPAATQLDGLPPKMQAVIQARLDQLSPEARALAEIAAVVGRTLTQALLAQVSQQDEVAAAQAIDELWRRRLWREQADGHYDFSHDRIRDVTYAEIGPAKRRGMHHAVAKALESANADRLDDISGELAGHYESAGALNQALAHFQRAAARAKQLYAYGEAVRYLEKAIQVARKMPNDASARSAEIDLWHELGYARILVHDWASVPVGDAWMESHQLASQHGTLFQRGRALFSLGTVSRNRGRWRDARAYDEQALPIAEQAGDLDLLEHLLASYGTSLFHFGEFDRSRTYLEQALALSERRSAVATRVWSYGNLPRAPLLRLAKCLWMLGFPDQAHTAAAEMRVAAREHGNPMPRFGILDFSAMICTFSRDIDGAFAIGAELAQISAKYEYPFYARAAQMFRGWALAQQGDPEQGVRMVRASVDVHRARGNRMFEPYWRGLLAECLALAGETREAMREVDESLAFAEESGNAYWNVPLLGLRAELLQALGAPDEEIEAWHQRALALARAQDAKSLELRAALGLSRFWVRQGRSAQAQRLLHDIYARFTEGFEAPDLVEARALLGATPPTSPPPRTSRR